MDGCVSDILQPIKHGQKSDSFTAHFEQNFNATSSNTDLHKYMTLKVVNQINPIGAMDKFTKTNCKVCMEKRLTILKI